MEAVCGEVVSCWIVGFWVMRVSCMAFGVVGLDEYSLYWIILGCDGWRCIGLKLTYM